MQKNIQIDNHSTQTSPSSFVPFPLRPIRPSKPSWYFPWNTGFRNYWDNIITLNRVFICLPSYAGAIIIAVICILYGLCGICMLILIAMRPVTWIQNYERRLDVLIYLSLFSILMSTVFIFGIVLAVGITNAIESCFIHFLWSCVFHVAVALTLAILQFIYCIINSNCFDGGGFGAGVGNLMFVVMYSLVWMYFALAINTYRDEEYL